MIQFKKLLNKLKSNTGSAMVTVVVIVAFISVLATVLLYMVSYNYHMKIADVRTKESFYGAEEVLEIMRTQLIKDAQDASKEAFDNSISKYSYYSGLSTDIADALAGDPGADVSALQAKLSAFQQDYTDDFRDSFKSNYTKHFYNKTTGSLDYAVGISELFPGATNITTANVDGATAVSFDYNGMNVSIVEFDYNNAYNFAFDVISTIKIKAVSDKGYTSIISTEIKVDPPIIDTNFEKKGIFFKQDIEDCVHFTNWEKM